MLNMAGHVLGNLDNQPRCRLPLEYFTGRDTWLDCRAPDCLQIDAESNWGWNVAIVTLSHDPRPGYFGRTYGRLVRVDKNAFVAGFCLLFNCWIGENSVLALGSVLRSQNIPANEMWAGNPARPIMQYIDDLWRPV